MSVSAEIIAVGTELLLGQILNSNAQFLSRELASLGINVYHQSVVGDNIERIGEQLTAALSRSEVIVLCGGLGPTEDDCTREGVATALGLPLILDAKAQDCLTGQFNGRPMTENNLRQAFVPEGATVLQNPRGTAPGLFIQHLGCLVFLLPGPPRELTHMFTNEVVPMLRRYGYVEDSICSRTLHMAGIGESSLATVIGDLIFAQTDPTIALYSRLGEVDVRLTTKAADVKTARERIFDVEQEIVSRLGEYIFAYDGQSLAGALGEVLIAQSHTLGVAESCTGGLLGHLITEVAGSSAYFLGGAVCYSNAAKREFLAVSDETLMQYGAVSEECAREMLLGAICRLDSSVGIAVTGIAGPDGGSEKKPVGTVCLAYGSVERHQSVRLLLRGERAAVKERAAREGMRRLLLWLKENEPR